MKNKSKTVSSIIENMRVKRKTMSRRGTGTKKTIQRRKPALRKRLTQKENERAELGQIFNDGYHYGFSKGYEDGHFAAYKKRP